MLAEWEPPTSNAASEVFYSISAGRSAEDKLIDEYEVSMTKDMRSNLKNYKHLAISGPCFEQSGVCSPILRALPDWFGIEEATRQYIEDTNTMPTWLAIDGDTTIGFLTVQMHFSQSAEIHVMGVLPAHHRSGAGRKLILAAEEYLCEQGVSFLQVKTLSARHPDPFYAKTRQFYLAMGFIPLQEIPELWGADNPCLQMVKAISLKKNSS
ncbi:MAG: hypothetical protein CVU39_00810 [Chloroflexi bacterium HGW-Chloroflexi-10]|nr:MAG: hypothetical protein CVU39_00810 [Chloroflexi bacterium HGW-Chloroflexi-10]